MIIIIIIIFNCFRLVKLKEAKVYLKTVPFTKITFISDLFGGVILASSTLISPAGILFKHWKEKKNSALVNKNWSDGLHEKRFWPKVKTGSTTSTEMHFFFAFRLTQKSTKQFSILLHENVMTKC